MLFPVFIVKSCSAVTAPKVRFFRLFALKATFTPDMLPKVAAASLPLPLTSIFILPKFLTPEVKYSSATTSPTVKVFCPSNFKVAFFILDEMRPVVTALPSISVAMEIFTSPLVAAVFPPAFIAPIVTVF